ncbi:MAG: BlaI/MecI/CopY family transcriptional regulator [Candidatus Omnitrophica bacterium]|nr:BlaI/MecI/CopY family transcriptional regulator [Candidatus Omnitrophota bacterium]
MAQRKRSVTELTQSEWVVMKAVWEGIEEEVDVTATEIHPQIEEELEWHFSTLKTTMDRLVRKGYLESRIRGKTCFYKPAVEQEVVVKKSVGEFLDTILDGAFGPLVAYLAEKKKLSKKEIQELERILEEDLKKERKK